MLGLAFVFRRPVDRRLAARPRKDPHPPPSVSSPLALAPRRRLALGPRPRHRGRRPRPWPRPIPVRLPAPGPGRRLPPLPSAPPPHKPLAGAERSLRRRPPWRRGCRLRRRPPGFRASALAAPLGLFALLCFSNCALISVWEDEVDRSHGETSLAQQYRLTAKVAGALPWVLGAAGLRSPPLGGGRARRPAPAARQAAPSSACVALLERRIGRVRARVLADVALMTPVVPLILGRFP